MRTAFAIVLSAAAVACSHPAPPVQPHVEAQPPPKIMLAVLPADKLSPFPKVVKAADAALADAHVTGIDETKMIASSIADVQLQIECDDPTPSCYVAAGKELHADRLLFAKIEAAPKKQVDVTITLFDVDGQAVTNAAHQVYASEAAAVAGVPALVAEATK